MNGSLSSSTQSPTVHRRFAVLLASALTVTSAEARADAWTERDVVRAATETAPAVLVARARSALARAEQEAAGRAPDPSLAFEREETLGPGGAHATNVALVVPLDLSGRRSVLRALARADAADAESDALLARNAAVAAAVLAFYDVIASERRVEVASEAVRSIEEAARILARREEAGAASGYDRTRLELEAELATSTLADARARLESSRALLRAMLLPLERALPALRGELEPGAPPAVANAADRARRRSAIARARDALRAANDAEGSASSAWIPELSLTGGLRIEGTDETRYGYVAGVTLDLPVFSGAAGLPAIARARAGVARARAESLEREARRDIAVAHARLVAAREELARFRAAVAERLELLRRGSQTAYREGTRPLADLLDAQHVENRIHEREIELAAEARRADVELRAAMEGW